MAGISTADQWTVPPERNVKEPDAMSTATRQHPRGVTVLHGVPYRWYARLAEDPRNYGLRMTYHDGTLEIMSPDFIHENPAAKLGVIVRAVASELEIPCVGARCTTFRRGGQGRYRGKGKEPDESFYLNRVDWLIGRERIDLDAGDPPPDLWIEVDNRASARGKLPVYAELGVPEVWRYRSRSKKLVFFRLIVETRTYEAIDRSLNLPMLTPKLVLDALALGERLDESAWDRRLRQWVRETFGAPGA
jgi:Uma2 family endonuclease